MTDLLDTLLSSRNETLATAAEELAKIDARTCEHCGDAFKPRTGSGGKPQKFCSIDCRVAFHAQRDQRSASHVGESDVDPIPKASGPPIARTAAPAATDDDEFWWRSDNPDIIVPEQRATAVYENTSGQIVIRQERDWNEEDDVFVVIDRQNLQAVIDRLCDIAGIGNAR